MSVEVPVDEIYDNSDLFRIPPDELLRCDKVRDDVLNLANYIAKQGDTVSAGIATDIRVEADRIFRRVEPFLSMVLEAEERGDWCDGLGDLELTHSNGLDQAFGRTRLFFSPSSSLFAHGADMLMPISSLIETILRSGERILEVGNLTWLKPVSTALDLAVFEKKFESYSTDGYSVVGEFLTSQGRTLVVYGKSVEDVLIEKKVGRNQYALYSICGCENCMIETRGSKFTFKIQKPRAGNWQEELSSSSRLLTSTIFEILNGALLQTKNSILKGEILLKVMVGVRGFELPSSVGDLFGDDSNLELRFERDKSKTSKEGFLLVPFTFRFSYQKNWATGMVAVTDDEDLYISYLFKNGIEV